MGSNKKGRKAKPKKASPDNCGMIEVDPNRVRFQHARIRPYFSGCGRSVEQTLESIREGLISPSDLPPIQVIIGPESEDDGQPWYFSLNNRRLWVLKRCREEGLLHNNKIHVRVRKPKSDQEAARYSLQNCALEAKIMFEKEEETPKPGNHHDADANEENDDSVTDSKMVQKMEKLQVVGLSSKQQGNEDVVSSSDDEEESSDDSSDDDIARPSNRFSALL